MGFNHFRLNVIARVLGITITVFSLIYLLKAQGYFFTVGFAFALVVYQAWALINLMEKTNKELVSFLSSIRYDDFSQMYRLTGRGGSFDELNNEFNKVLQHFKEIRAEKEAEYQYLKNIIHHIGIGLLSFDRHGNVQIINTAAKKLFKVGRLQNISKLEEFSPELTETFHQLRTGAKALVRIRKNGETIQLAVYAIELFLKGEEFKLVTIQNIHSELEEQEMEAWQNLIRVLTHEIMNSITPITSLAATVEDEMEQLKESGTTLSGEDVDDVYLAIQTIKRRSEALIRFVSEFRSLSHVPKPKFAHVKVADMFSHIQTLLAHDFNQKNIRFDTHIEPAPLIITADQEQVEQVLINLLQNAVQALEEMNSEENPERRIVLSAYQDKKNRPVISVKDNGPGIDKDVLEHIFIPLYTTKKNGSGIGLSLSRQIMRQHKGSITVKSNPEEGTVFNLRF